MKVFVTRRIPEEGLRILRRFPRARRFEDADGVLCLLTDRMDRARIESAPNLKIIAVMAVGYNNVDVEAACERGIVVTNTPDVLTEATADLTWALILSTARRVVEADRFLREGRFKGWDPLLLVGADVSGKTLGIIGPGRIGKAVAKRARGFGMKVLFAGRGRRPLERLLRESDFVSLHCPLSAETHHLIGRRELEMMKRTAILINTARGPIVDEKALVRALGKGVIAGAGLDVYEEEPRVEAGLLKKPNVVLLPHIGSATRETRGRMAEIAARNVAAVLTGQPPLTPISSRKPRNAQAPRGPRGHRPRA